jgi:hypothetical protein
LRDRKNNFDVAANVTGMAATLFLILACAGKILRMPGTSILMVLFLFLLALFIAAGVIKMLRSPDTNLRYGLVAFMLSCTGSFMMLVSFHTM